MWMRVVVALAALAAAGPCVAQPAATRTRHVFLVMLDGLRWQEVFTGADEALMTKEAGGVEKPEAVRARWWRETPEARREVLMPFLWGTIAREGQVYGNRSARCEAVVTNGIGVSYPGYAEALCGFADASIKDNRQIPNPNPTVLEWLHGRPGFAGRVAALGAWDTFRFIFRQGACGFPVDDGNGPLTAEGGWGELPPEIATVNALRAETPQRWGGVTFDSMIFRAAKPWVLANKPRVVFLGLGETDEWAHECDYARYLEAAHRDDGYIRELWESLQGTAEYRGTTTLLILPDHGRGDMRGGARDWGSHGVKHAGSLDIWLAALGPDTPALGVMRGRGEGEVMRITQSQVAATVAALVGEDYEAAEPRAGKVIGAVLGR